MCTCIIQLRVALHDMFTLIVMETTSGLYKKFIANIFYFPGFTRETLSRPLLPVEIDRLFGTRLNSSMIQRNDVPVIGSGTELPFECNLSDVVTTFLR